MKKSSTPAKQKTSGKYTPSGNLSKKYSSFLVLDIYRLLEAGCTDKEVSKVIGISEKRLNRWKEKHEFLRYAYQCSEEQNGAKSGETMEAYIYDRLPDNLKSLWDDIAAAEPHPADPTENVFRKGYKYDAKAEVARKLLRKKSEKEQQVFFIHALIKSSFNPTTAMKKVGISKSTVDRWISDDLEFAELVREVEFHKKNFLEESLMKLVEGGHAHATIFANRTQNHDRGYGDKSTLRIEGEINITQRILPIEALNLPKKTMRTLLASMKQAEPIDEGAKPLALPMGAKGEDVEQDEAEDAVIDA